MKLVRGRISVALAVLVALVAPAADPPWLRLASSSATHQLDLQVGVLGTGGCTAFGDSAGVLVSVTGAQPGTVVARQALCVRNAGNIAGRLTMRDIERVDVETDCSPGEAAVDPTCGSGPGEVGASLVHVVASDRNCKGSTNDPLAATFDQLDSGRTVLYDTVGPKQTFCITIEVRYNPPSVAAELAGQSDRVTWRYRFALST